MSIDGGSQKAGGHAGGHAHQTVSSRVFLESIKERQRDIPAGLPDNRNPPLVWHPTAFTPFGKSFVRYAELARELAQKLPVGIAADRDHLARLPQSVGITTAFLQGEKTSILANVSRHGRKRRYQHD